MKCNDIKIELKDYLDNKLTKDEKKRIKEHLESCPECSAHLEFLKAYSKVAKSVKPVKAPKKFAEAVRERIEKENVVKEKSTLWQFLSRPMILQTLSVAAVLMVVITIVLLQPEKRVLDTGIVEKPAETEELKDGFLDKKEAPEAEVANGKVKGARDRALVSRKIKKVAPPVPAAAKKLKRREKIDTEAIEDSVSKFDKPKDSPTRTITISLIPHAIESIKRSASGTSSSIESADRSMDNKKQSLIKEKSAPAMEQKKSEAESAVPKPVVYKDRIVQLVKKYGGTVKEKPGRVKNIKESLRITLPSANMNSFLNELGSIGSFRRPLLRKDMKQKSMDVEINVK